MPPGRPANATSALRRTLYSYVAGRSRVARAPDGAEIVLKSALLRKSMNVKSMATGHAYPLYYDTLFVDLRDAFTGAAATAREKGLGYGDTTAPCRASPSATRRRSSATLWCSPSCSGG
jgi:hypothetical protein